MNHIARALLLFLGIIPLLAGFQCCKGPSNPGVNVTDSPPSLEQNFHQESQESMVTPIASEKDFNAIIKKPTIVKFTATWCGACKVIQPLYEKIAQKLHAKYQFVTIDVDKFPALADTYQIRGMPTFLFFNNGEKLDGQIIGAAIKQDEFLKKIEDIFEH